MCVYLDVVYVCVCIRACVCVCVCVYTYLRVALDETEVLVCFIVLEPIADLFQFRHALWCELESRVIARLPNIGDIQKHIGAIAVNILQTPRVEDVDTLVRRRHRKFVIERRDRLLDRVVIFEELLLLLGRHKLEYEIDARNHPHKNHHRDNHSVSGLENHGRKLGPEEELHSIRRDLDVTMARCQCLFCGGRIVDGA